ncbi:hypothetical protein V4F39_20690 [Aquincola sp. MAHUQ-54]|uniref:Uncharacterized protein n=1 Tax=Aquincola agrisoli TaxID=3119538 RepID=A0AAW9QP38_9BURK
MADDPCAPPSPAAPDLVDAVCEALRGHLRQHPRAADTAQGIAEWWLGGTFPALPPHVLDSALERLAGEGLLAWRALPSGERLWYGPQDAP